MSELNVLTQYKITLSPAEMRLVGLALAGKLHLSGKDAEAARELNLRLLRQRAESLQGVVKSCRDALAKAEEEYGPKPVTELKAKTIPCPVPDELVADAAEEARIAEAEQECLRKAMETLDAEIVGGNPPVYVEGVHPSAEGAKAFAEAVQELTLSDIPKPNGPKPGKTARELLDATRHRMFQESAARVADQSGVVPIHRKDRHK